MTDKTMFDRSCDIASAVSSSIGYGFSDYSGFGWVSEQRETIDGKKVPTGYGFTVGQSFAYMSFDDFKKSDTELIDFCIVQILGHTLDSKEESERRVKWLRSLLNKIEGEQRELDERKNNCLTLLTKETQKVFN